MNLEQMTREELEQLISDAQKALKTLEDRRKAEARLAAEKAAKDFGFKLEEVLSHASKGGKSSKGAPQYADPDDPSRTWTGKGRKPNWVKEALENGKSLEDLKI